MGRTGRGTGGGDAPSSPSRILVVDDQEANARLLELILREAGYGHVSVATDPGSALAVAESGRPAVVLLDLQMPGVDAFALMALLRREEAREEAAEAGSTPPSILALAADARPETRRRALWEGAADVLATPVDPAELVLRIGRLLEVRRLRLAVLERERRLREAVARGRAILAALVEAEEQDRRRAAAEVHDRVLQALAAASLRLEAVLLRAEAEGSALPGPGTQALQELRTALDGAAGRLRQVALTLAPPVEEEDLVALLRHVLDRLAAERRMAYLLQNRLAREPGPAVRLAVVRVVQRVLEGMMEGAGPRAVTVVVESRDGGVLVRVRPNGGLLRGPPAGEAEGSAAGAGRPTGTETSSGRAEHGGEAPDARLAVARERAEMMGGWCRSVRAEAGGSPAVEVFIPEPEGTASASAG